MQIANILLSIAGDNRNQVPKYNVTPSEVAVLRIIHGDDAVTEIQPIGEVNRANREERQRLAHIYSHVMPDGSRRSPAVDSLFPGVAARVFENFDEIEDLPEVFFKAERRVSMKSAPAAAPKAKRAEAKAASAEMPVVAAETAEPEDGIGDINDGLGNTENLFQ